MIWLQEFENVKMLKICVGLRIGIELDGATKNNILLLSLHSAFSQKKQ